jgi:menaquinone-9 beta-reductase
MPPALTCDVLIVGAGPAGSTAARTLARAGWHVILADRTTFPRDKVCGDALISDALGTLATLGVDHDVLAGAARADELRLHLPGGRQVSLAGRFACLDRQRFDARLLASATGAGADFHPGFTVVSPLRTASGRVRGARFRTAGGPVDIDARHTLLATGANSTVLDAFGLGPPADAAAVAGRAYFDVPAAVAAGIRHLTIAYDRRWCPGYGWIFPAPGGRFNIGVGLFPQTRSGHRLREFWRWFTTRFEPAATLVRAATACTPFRGAPLRTGLLGAGFGMPGLLVAGEAAAVTYPATGEGIGKSMESGLLAAEYLDAALAGRGGSDRLHDVYGEEFRRRFAARYHGYRVAQRWAAHPLLLDLLGARANAGRFVRQELEALVDERGDPHTLFSTRGLITALLR